MDGFEEFWKLYPRKVGKLKAKKAWKKVKPEDKREIINHLPDRIPTDKQWLRDSGQFIPYPATFLNEGRWMDEFEVQLAVPKRKRNYKMFGDSTLLDICREKNITTHGKSRDQLILALDALDA